MQESLWWTSTHAEETEGPMFIEAAGKCWILPFVKKFDQLGDRFKRREKCEAGMKNILKKGVNSWFKEDRLCCFQV